MLKTLKLCAAIFLLTGIAYGQNIRYDNVAFSGRVPPNSPYLSGATVTVCTSSGSGLPCTPKASLCSSQTDTTCTSPNPITADAFGNYGFWMKPGTYIITITAAGFTGYSTTLTLDTLTSPPSTNAVQYVSTTGNDSNSGAFPDDAHAKLSIGAAQTACPATGCDIWVTDGAYSEAALTIGTPTKPITVHLGRVTITQTGSLTVSSGSSIIGSGESLTPESKIVCNINTTTPCLVTTNDYANPAQSYYNATRLENFLIECNTTGCSTGLSSAGFGIGAKISKVLIDQPNGACWINTDANSNDWTENLLVENTILNKCGADGLDINVASGGFFNDANFIDFQVRSQKGYFIHATSGNTPNLSVNRLTFNNFHGIVGTVTPNVQDGIFFTNGGGANSLSDWSFIGGEIEGNSQTGYPLNGAASGAASHVHIVGTVQDNFALGYFSPNISFDQLSGGGLGSNALGLYVPQLVVYNSGFGDTLTQPTLTTNRTTTIPDANTVLPQPLTATAGVYLTGLNGTTGALTTATISAGTITLSGGAGSHTFATAYGTAPVCTATDTTAANAVKVTSSTTAITLAGTTTDVIAWTCTPAAN